MPYLKEIPGCFGEHGTSREIIMVMLNFGSFLQMLAWILNSSSPSFTFQTLRKTVEALEENWPIKALKENWLNFEARGPLIDSMCLDLNA
jgi:hypothetical protein